jgi:hypothetical protein
LPKGSPEIESKIPSRTARGQQTREQALLVGLKKNRAGELWPVWVASAEAE